MTSGKRLRSRDFLGPLFDVVGTGVMPRGRAERRDLRLGVFDVLIGINLLREGLDIPEVSLVAILDADKEGFLRSRRSLIQTIGRAARNAKGTVILYADTLTRSINEALSETNRRRKIQEDHNKQHNIAPQSVHRKISKDLKTLHGFIDEEIQKKLDPEDLKKQGINSITDVEKSIKKKNLKMKRCAKKLDFENAALLRDEIKNLKAYLLVLGGNYHDKS